MLNTYAHPTLTGNKSSQSRRLFSPPPHLLGRLYLLAGILTLDSVALASVPHVGTLLGPLAPAGIAAFAVFLGLGHSALKSNSHELRFSWLLLYAHFVCVAAVIACNVAELHGSDFFVSRQAHLALSSITVVAIAILALACVPFSAWINNVRNLTSLWLAAIVAGVAAGILQHPFRSLWNSSGLSLGVALQNATFHCVQAVLRHLLPDLIAEPARLILGTPRFLVFIAPECSGLEGLGLVLVFTVVWLWYFRKENRFPQALLLIPCALVSVWLLNIVRIATIILIGDAGAADVAMVGFHSQAGWIAFTVVALLFCTATRKIAWVRRVPAHAGDVMDGSLEMTDQGESPATVAYLVPFLAILAASFITKAASGYFDWLYPLRFIVAAIALWCFRSEYKKLDWRFSWIAPATGVAVFLVWIAPVFWESDHAASSLGAALAALPVPMRTIWITFRVAAAVITVPIAEELAFRGYLARRLMGRNFEELSFSTLGGLSVCLSSIAFGLMHGSHWFVGTLAGLAYAVVLRWRGRIGDAIAAHATSNLLLAAWVLMRADWSFW